jgi:hypothetical protein
VLYSDEEFIAAWEKSGSSPTIVADLLRINIRNVYKRRANLANRGILLSTSQHELNVNQRTGWRTDEGRAYSRENAYGINNGTIVVFSDAHFWPNHDQTIANMALVEIVKELKPKAIVANGDIFDGAGVSRHPPLGWSKLPSVKEELEVCDERLHEIVLAAKTSCDLFWNVGNHDARLDRTLCTNVPEFQGVVQRLEERFHAWNFAWSLNVNDHTMIKHRYHNGINATYNNTLKSGRSIVTGHLHRLAVTPWADYNGRRYGVDTGTLADPHGPQFDYAENNPSPHTSGFAVLTFRNGSLLPPELVEVIDDVAYFRGEAVVDGSV